MLGVACAFPIQDCNANLRSDLCRTAQCGILSRSDGGKQALIFAAIRIYKILALKMSLMS